MKTKAFVLLLVAVRQDLDLGNQVIMEAPKLSVDLSLNIP